MRFPSFSLYFQTGESKSQPNVNFSAPMIIDQQDEAESNIMDMETTLESLTQCTTGKIDDIPLSEELRYAMSNMTDSDDVSLINLLKR